MTAFWQSSQLEVERGDAFTRNPRIRENLIPFCECVNFCETNLTF